MSNRATQIGFSQRIRLEWRERTANLVLAGKDKVAVNACRGRPDASFARSFIGESYAGRQTKVYTAGGQLFL